MNVITRGIRGAVRSPLRSGAIVAMLAISIGLIIAMLVAHSSVLAKINEVKTTTATDVTINPAGVRGAMGGGDPLTADQVSLIAKTPHIVSINAVLTDQLASTDTNLTSSLELGSFGRRQQSGQTTTEGPASNTPSSDMMPPTPRITVTGTTTPASSIGDGAITSGTTIDGSTSDLVALLGASLAAKNNLSVGSTFTAYGGKVITVQGIYTTDNTFENSGLIMPLASVQTLTDQAGGVSNVIAIVDSSDNVTSTVAVLKDTLGDAADITSQQQQAADSVAPLQSIARLALTGVIGASIAAAVIVLLAMTMVVRERRREIGVIKAIGGTSRGVIIQFATEALALTIAGGVVGLGLGIAVSGPITQSLVSSQTSATSSTGVPSSGRSLIPGGREDGDGGTPGNFGQRINTKLEKNLKNVTSTLTPQTFAIGIGIMLVIAIIGSAIPAWVISRVRPAEVLRTE